MPTTTDKFRPDINGLRAIAVIAVVLFHFNVPGCSGGFLGVDVFFVISGYLMTQIIVTRLSEGRFSVWEFYLARARRIVPALSVLCAGLLVFGWLSLDPANYTKLAQEVASALSFVSNFLFWQQAGYFDTASRQKWLLHTWSLSAEWQFYLLFPLGLMAIWKSFRTQRALFLGVLLSFLFSLLLSILVTSRRPDLAYYALPTRAWEMLAGALVFQLSSAFPIAKALSRWMELGGLALILGGTAILDSSYSWPGYYALIPVIGTALVILARNTSSALTANPVSAFIGKTSYSIYLWHWPVVVALSYRQLDTTRPGIAAGICLSLLLGYLSYLLVEQPSRTPQAARLRSAALRIVMPAVALIFVALIAYQWHGFPIRLGADEPAYLAAVDATEDYELPGGTNCRKEMDATYCEHGKGNRLIMFIGDSIAEELHERYELIDSDSDAVHLRFVTRRGCPPIRRLKGCERFADAAWAAVREHRPQELVLASQWWLSFFYAGGGMRDGPCHTTLAGCLTADMMRKVSDAFGPLEEDIREAENHGTHVYILNPVPISPVDYGRAKEALLSSRHLFLPLLNSVQENVWVFGGKEEVLPTSSDIDLSSNHPVFRFAAGNYAPPVLIGRLLSNVGMRTGARNIQPDRYLCIDDVCPLGDQLGNPIYTDAIHLRRNFVRSESMAWLDRVLDIDYRPAHDSDNAVMVSRMQTITNPAADGL